MIGPEIAIALAPWHAVYVEIPKVACTSFKQALADVLWIELDADRDPHEADFPFLTATSGPRFFPGQFAFSFVRDPYARLVSCWRDKIMLAASGYTRSTIRPGLADCLAPFDVFQPSMPFDAFAAAVAEIDDAEADPHFRSQAAFVLNNEGEPAVDFIGRLENLDEDLAIIDRRIGLELSLPRSQVSSGEGAPVPVRTPRLEALVGARYAADFELIETISHR